MAKKPIVVEATGTIVRQNNQPNLSLQDQLNAEVQNCLAEGITDPEVIKLRKLNILARS